METPILQPERSRTFEAGGEVISGNEQITAQATYFRRHIQDVIVFSFVPGYLNQDKQDGEGVELQASWQVLEQLRVSGQYTYLEGETTTLGSQEQDSSFFNLLRRPRHSWTGTILVQPIPRLTVSVQAQYQSEREDLFFDPVTFIPEKVMLNGFLLVNAHTDYQLPNQSLTLFADVRNVTDTDYTEVYGFNTLGINVQAGIQFNLLQ